MRVKWLLSLLLLAALAVHSGRAAEDNEFAEFEDDDVPATPPTPPPQPPPADEFFSDGKEETEAKQPELKRRHHDTDDDDFGVEGEDELDLSEDDGTPAAGIKADKNGEGLGGISNSPLKFADVPAHFRSNWGSYQVEAIVIGFIALYLINYLAGKSANASIAYSWVGAHRGALEEQFAVVGDDGTSELPSSGQFSRENDAVYSMWCTGRQGVNNALITIRTVKRHCMVSRIWQKFGQSVDRVMITFDMEAGELDSFVLAVGQKKSLSKLQKEMTDLASFTVEKKVATTPALPNSFVVYSESSEAVTNLFDPPVLALLKKYENFVEYIHISDQFTGIRPAEGDTEKFRGDPKRLITFSFILNNQSVEYDRTEEESELLKMAFYIVEKMRRFRLSREAKAKSDKRRQAALEAQARSNHQARQEAAQARREEKTRERKQRLLEEEDPDKQRRLERIEAKHDKKAKQPKMKQLKMK